MTFRMMRDRVVCVAIAAMMGQLACTPTPAPSVATTPSEPRFRAPGDLVLADSGEAKPVNRDRHPRYPVDMRDAGIEAGFAALFVVDTTGHVEYPTISFTAGVAPSFRAAVCSYLRDTQFTPVVRDGAPRHALVVNPFTFALSGGIWYGRRYDGEPLRRAIVTDGIASAVARLEAQPHC